MDSEDHDFLIRIRQLIESFITEVRSEFNKIASDKRSNEIALDLTKVDISNLKKDLALVQRDIDYLKKECDCLPNDVKIRLKDALAGFNADLETVKKSLDEKMTTMKFDIEQKIKDNREEAKSDLGLWVAIAAVIAGLVGTALGIVFG